MATISITSDGTLEHAKLKNRTTRANHIVRNHSIVSGAIGIVPIPPLGVALIIANGLKMVHKLSSIYGVEFNKEIGKSAISSFLAGCGTFSISGRLIWGLSTALPAAAPVVGVVTRPLFSTAMMYAMGKIFIQHFESGGTFLTFDPEKVREHYAGLFEEGKKLTKD
ncbi:MAG: hypothetical protein DRR42_15765 [Gammaproteobacteria bacterium]|nr:MAG: hypothetical protein DRR42_15765 [Gammaproteobacteria bacterium]